MSLKGKVWYSQQPLVDGVEDRLGLAVIHSCQILALHLGIVPQRRTMIQHVSWLLGDAASGWCAGARQPGFFKLCDSLLAIADLLLEA